MPVTIPPAYGFQPINDALSSAQARAFGGGASAKDLDQVLSQAQTSSQGQSMALGQLSMAINTLTSAVNRLSSMLPMGGGAPAPMLQPMMPAYESFQPYQAAPSLPRFGLGVGTAAGALSRLPSGGEINGRIFQGLHAGYSMGPRMAGGLGGPSYGYAQMVREGIGGLPGGMEGPYGGTFMRDRGFLSLLFQSQVGPGITGMARFGGPVTQEAAREELSRKVRRGLWGVGGAAADVGGFMGGASLVGGGMIGGMVGGLLGGAAVGAVAAPLMATGMEMAGLGDIGETLRMAGPRVMQGRRGKRLGREELADMSSYLVRTAAKDPVIGQSDMQQILAGAVENDLFLGVRNTRDFRTKMQQLVEANKEIARSFHLNFREATHVIAEFRNMGFDPSQAAGITGRVAALADIAGVRRTDILKFGQQGAEIARAAGAPTQAGFRMGMEAIGVARTAAGYLPAATLAEVGGTTGLAQTITQAGMQHMTSPYGQAQMAAGMISGKGTGLGAAGYGAFGINETLGMAAQNLNSPQAIMQFMSNKQRMMRRRARDPLLVQEDMGNTAIRLITERGLDVNEDSMVTMLVAINPNLSEEQARAVARIHPKLPEMRKEIDAAKFLEAGRTREARKFEERSILTKITRGVKGAFVGAIDLLTGEGFRGGVAEPSRPDRPTDLRPEELERALGKKKETKLGGYLRRMREGLVRVYGEEGEKRYQEYTQGLEEAGRLATPQEQAKAVRGLGMFGGDEIAKDIASGKINIGRRGPQAVREELLGRQFGALSERLAESAQLIGGRGAAELVSNLRKGGASAAIDILTGADSPQRQALIGAAQGKEGESAVVPEIGAALKSADPKRALATLFAERSRELGATSKRKKEPGATASQEELEGTFADSAELLKNLVTTSQHLVKRAERLP